MTYSSQTTSLDRNETLNVHRGNSYERKRSMKVLKALFAAAFVNPNDTLSGDELWS